MASVEQRLTVLQRKTDQIIQRIDSHQNNNAPLRNNTNESFQNDQTTYMLPPLPSRRVQPQYQLSMYQPPPPMHPPPPPPPTQSGWQGWSCFMLWLGLGNLFGGIGMLISGAISVAASASKSSSVCPSPYSYFGGQCCYMSYCYDQSNGSIVSVSGIVLLCVGFVTGIIGIALLVKANQFYRNNNAACC